MDVDEQLRLLENVRENRRRAHEKLQQDTDERQMHLHFMMRNLLNNSVDTNPTPSQLTEEDVETNDSLLIKSIVAVALVACAEQDDAFDVSQLNGRVKLFLQHLSESTTRPSFIDDELDSLVRVALEKYAAVGYLTIKDTRIENVSSDALLAFASIKRRWILENFGVDVLTEGFTFPPTVSEMHVTSAIEKNGIRRRKRACEVDLEEFESKCAKYSALINKHLQKVLAAKTQPCTAVKSEFERRAPGVAGDKSEATTEGKTDDKGLKSSDLDEKFLDPVRLASEHESVAVKGVPFVEATLSQSSESAAVGVAGDAGGGSKPIECDPQGETAAGDRPNLTMPPAPTGAAARDRAAKATQRGGAASYVDFELRAVFEDVVETLLRVRSFEEHADAALDDEVDALLRAPTFLERAERDCFRARPYDVDRELDGPGYRPDRSTLYEFCPFGTRDHCAEVRAAVLRALLDLDAEDLDVDVEGGRRRAVRSERLVSDLRARLACITPATLREVQFERLDLAYLSSQLAAGTFDNRVAFSSAQRGVGPRFAWRGAARFAGRAPYPPGPPPGPGPGPAPGWPRRDVPPPSVPPFSAYRRPFMPPPRFPSAFVPGPSPRYPAPPSAAPHAGWLAASRAGVPDAVLEHALAVLVGACDRVHFVALTTPFTDEASGDCSYLNTCFTKHETCKFVHYDVDLNYMALAQIRSQQSVSPVVIAASRIRDYAARHPAVACELLGLSPTESALLSVRLERLVYPPQWISCDLRTFDMTVLGKFAVVMADPPWDIHMELPYGTITDTEVRRLNVPCLQEEGGLIFLWVTVRAQDLARQCLADWGYQRVDELVWVKTNQLQRLIRTGRTGHWLNHGKEHCLIGIKLRSGPTPFSPADCLSDAAVTTSGRQAVRRLHCGLDVDVLVSEVRATSRKPDEIYGVLERLSPGTRKIELFGRQHNVQPNWMTLGNQLNGVRIVEPNLVRRFKEKYGSAACGPSDADFGPGPNDPSAIPPSSM